MHPTGSISDQLCEVPFTAVVCFAPCRVIREVFRRRLMGLEQHPGQVLKRVVGYQASVVEVEDMRHVGQIQPMVEVRRISDLGRETGIDQRLGGSKLGRPGKPITVIGHATSLRAIASIAVVTPPVCQNTTGPRRPAAANSTSTAAAFAV